MEAIYVDPKNVQQREGDTFEITVSGSEIDRAEAERAKLYLDVDSMEEAEGVRFYWYTDAKKPIDFPVAGPHDFEELADDTFRLSVNVSDQLSEHPS